MGEPTAATTATTNGENGSAYPFPKVKTNGLTPSSSSHTNGVSNGRRSPPTSTPTTPSSLRHSRLTHLSAGESTLSQTANGISPSTPATPHSGFKSGTATPTNPFSESVRNFNSQLEARLKTHSASQSWAGGAARRLLDLGEWAEEKIEEEWENRTNAIGGLDNLWLLLSSVSDFNPVCTATYTFDKPLHTEDAYRAAEKQVARFPRYHQRLSNFGKSRRWHATTFEDDPDFDLSNHISTYHLPGAAGPLELDQFTARFITQPWDFARPLWNSVLIPNYVDEATNARGAMVTRGHHTLADGQGFVLSQMIVTSFGPELEKMLADGSRTIREARRGTAKPSTLHKGLKPLDKYRSSIYLQLFMFMLYWVITLFQTFLEFLGSFNQAWFTSVMFLGTFWRTKYASGYIAGDRPAEREFSASKAFPMEQVKTIQRAFSGPAPGSWADRLLRRNPKAKSTWGHLTLNDVLCTVVADVLAEELDNQPPQPGVWAAFKRGADKVWPQPISLFIPISVRQIGDTSMRNMSSGAVAYLPRGEAGLPTTPKSLHKRLHGNRQRLSIIKQSLLPKLFFSIVQLTGQFPILFPSPEQWKPLRRTVTFFESSILSAFTAVLTNVPGPAKEPITLEGHTVQRWTALPPQAGKGTLGIGVISYAGTIAISVSADHVPGPSEGVAKRLTENFEKRWAQYVEAAEGVMAAKQKKRR